VPVKNDGGVYHGSPSALTDGSNSVSETPSTVQQDYTSTTILPSCTLLLTPTPSLPPTSHSVSETLTLSTVYLLTSTAQQDCTSTTILPSSAVLLTPTPCPEYEAKGKKVVEDVIRRIDNSGIFPPNNGFLRRIAWVESRFGKYPGTFRNDYHGGIWQVDEIGFRDTQNTTSHPKLKGKYEKICEKLKIDWENTTWEDLRKPLYSGLAARLFLGNLPSSIPDTLQGQAIYWKENYNKTGKGTAEKFIEDVEALEK
jgi:hypothetical protein